MLDGLIKTNKDQTLSHRVIFHHLLITAMSTLLPSDRMLKITLDNAIHIMTPPCTGSVTTPYHMHLYLNPHDRLPFLQHTCSGSDAKPYCFIVTTSLPSQRAESSNSRCRPMLRTTAHVLDLVTTLTFPADSPQHHQSILTLATHLFLTIPIITPQQSWNIIREKTSHRHTLQLILATVTLKRHYLVWHTVMKDPPATHNLHRMPIETLSHKPKRRAALTSKHRSPKRQRLTKS